MDSLLIGRTKVVERRRGYYYAKRALDLLIAGLGFLVCLPLLLLIACLIKLDSPGPAIFRQPRVGYRKQLFQMFKFRTMQVEHLGEGLKPAAPDDGRLTRAGRWLRRTSLDELPQLFNVLRGEMSLVGPRPEQGFLLKHYPPAVHRRFDVLPGLTGWWQVNGRRQPIYEYADYDLYYVENQSLKLDLKILLLTVRAVISADGAV
ncbi:MAG: sugar transferase [Chloroflexi bacterium]|nr:sugar transferase [Chloroflexota bacterium]